MLHECTDHIGTKKDKEKEKAKESNEDDKDKVCLILDLWRYSVHVKRRRRMRRKRARVKMLKRRKWMIPTRPLRCLESHLLLWVKTLEPKWPSGPSIIWYIHSITHASCADGFP